MENNTDSYPQDYHKLSIAPMMAITNNHYRQLARLLTKETLLYTEMIHHDTIIHQKEVGKDDLAFEPGQNPIVLQLGGNDPELLGKVAELAKASGYDEINLNCGCPSSKVTKHNFGACLMKEPNLVADCIRSIRKVTNLETTVKCRIGLDEDNPEFLDNFIKTVSSQGGANHFIIHSRLAIMGLNTDQNRKIPPLKYERAYQLKQDFPELSFSINGGIKSLSEVEGFLANTKMIGCMVGRAAYENMWQLSEADGRIYGKTQPVFSRKDVILEYSDYCDKVHNEFNTHDLIKPLTFLFANERKNNIYKKMLYEIKGNDIECLSDHIKTVLESYEKMNSKAVNSLNIID
jgi:tRNA-dihydrouridine synthase A